MRTSFNQAVRLAGGKSRGVLVCGPRLRQLRLLAGYTQAELADCVGYSERLIRRAEAGGVVSTKALNELAKALSDELQTIQLADLCSSPLDIAKQFVESYDRLGSAMLAECGHLLTEDFVFHFAGDPRSTLSGPWQGRYGLQQWLHTLFSLGSRASCENLRATYLEANHRVTAHYSDHWICSDRTQHSMWVNLHFIIDGGLISRIDNECDSSVICKLEHA